MKKGQAKRYYTFGPFRLDETERLLSGAQGIVPLTPKAFETLLFLVQHSGHVLSKDELMSEVWPDSFVEENNLAQNISLLRKALGEEAGGQKYIETVPKRGYRFVAEVRESLGGATRRPERWPLNEMQASGNEQQPQKGKLFWRDVVLIGRAIDFK
jgi:DNA-binding winged helix-turn-helix (wHTH) protein